MSISSRLEQVGVALLATRLSVLGHDPCGGSEVLLWEDREILRQAGIPVRVYGRAAGDGTPVVRVPVRSKLPLISSLEYCGRFLLNEPRALLMACNEPMVAGLAPDRAVVRFDWSTPLPRYWRLPGWLSRFQRALYLFPSESERKLFLQLHPLIPPDATVVIANAVDLNLFRPEDHKKPGLRVGFAGQWVERKGVNVLLKAWPRVKESLPEAELLFVGGARLWKTVGTPAGVQEIVVQVGKLANRGIVRVAGELKRAEMPNFWNSLSAAVVPSLYEPFGLVALEALACGVPVVASAVGGLSEIVVDGQCGLLVPPNDPRALAEVLFGLLRNHDLRSRLAAGARRRAEAFSLERRSSSLLELLARRSREAMSCVPSAAQPESRWERSLMATGTEMGGKNLTGRVFHTMVRSRILRSVYGACRRVPVLGSLLHAGVDGLLPHGSRAWTSLPEGMGKGLWFYCDPRFELGYVNGNHEPWVQDVLRTHLQPGDCFYDVGAHTGFFSLIAACFVGAAGVVVAFEADPENAGLLRTNVARNQMPQVKVVEAAVWSSPGLVYFERASPASNRTEGRVALEGKGNGSGVMVATTSLDEVIYGLRERAPRLVKIDVEGAEWEVLQGARRALAELRPHLLCEVHEPAKMEAFCTLLRDFGYTTEHWQPVHPSYPGYRQHYIWAVAK